jgi:hypothetical protein
VQLLVAVVHEEDKLEAVLSGLVELGAAGATLVPSEGMARVLLQESPIFADVDAFARYARPRNYMLFSVLPDELVDAVFALLDATLGGLARPGTGIAFTVPVDRVLGLASPLGGTNATR